MQVRCDEGVAIHIGPKPCFCAREGAGEASAGERIGQPLSRESHIIPGADVLIPTEGDMAERDIPPDVRLAGDALRERELTSDRHRQKNY